MLGQPARDGVDWSAAEREGEAAAWCSKRGVRGRPTVFETGCQGDGQQCSKPSVREAADDIRNGVSGEAADDA